MSKLFDDKQLYPLLFQNDFSKIKKFLDKYGLDSVDRDGRSFLTNCIAEHKNSFAKKIIELGADVNQLDNDGAPPLFTAIREKNVEMLKELLSNLNLDKNIQDNYGKNALGIALQAHPKDNNLMIFLVEEGIDPFVRDKKGKSPYLLMKKYESGEITKGGSKLNIEPVIKKIEDTYIING